MALTEYTTLDEVLSNESTGSVTVTWRDHIARNGVEIDSARIARSKTYTAETKADFLADLGNDASKYASLL
jgi:hypothetical protein